MEKASKSDDKTLENSLLTEKFPLHLCIYVTGHKVWAKNSGKSDTS